MFNMGMTEMLIIAAIALVVIGPEKLPGLARALGKGLTEFRKAVGDLKGSMSEEFSEIKKTADPNIQDLAKMANNLKNIHTPKNVEDYLTTAADALDAANKSDEEKTNGEETAKADEEEHDYDDSSETYEDFNDADKQTDAAKKKDDAKNTKDPKPPLKS